MKGSENHISSNVFADNMKNFLDEGYSPAITSNCSKCSSTCSTADGSRLETDDDLKTVMGEDHQVISMENYNDCKIDCKLCERLN